MHSDVRTHNPRSAFSHPVLPVYLIGDWLEEAGFGTDTPVTIGVERGQLVIRAAE
ncbi:SymE family type I addiction module toxin [Buttiauxella ferragutiae]|uniref:SymE family type I addiction module toxin n=1 Tax=Buttiauxella ferragutiae TaxID=82989 RepID=UPI0030D616D0